MSNTGLTTQQLFNTTAAAILADLKVKFTAIMNQDLAGKGDQANQLMTMVVGWYDRAVQQVGAGAASITVPVSGSAPPSGIGGFPSLGGAQPFAPPAVQAGIQSFAPQQPAGGLGQPFGAPQFGAPGGFAAPNAFGGPAAPQAGNLPKGTAASLQACGRCRVPTSQSPEGAVCGVAHNKNECKGVVLYCTAAASKQGASGYWTCSAHVKRPSPDLTGRGAKKSGGSGGAVISPGQIGVGRPTGTPPGFGNNPGMANQIAGLMGQQPQQQVVPFGQPSAFGQQPAFGQPSSFNMPFGQPSQQTVANPGLSNQLMNSVQGQVSLMPQQQPGMPGAFNVNSLLSGGAPTSLPVNPGFNPMLSGIPSTPGFGGQQVAATVINTGAGFEEDDDDEDGESSNNEDESRPVPQADPNAVNAALQAAGFQPQQFQQQPQVSFQPAQVSFQPQQFQQQQFQQQPPPPVQFQQVAANPLNQIMQQAQAQQQAPAPEVQQSAAPNLLHQAMMQQTQQVPQTAPPAGSSTLADALKAATSGAPLGQTN